MVVIRENSEGEYADVGARLYPGTPQEIALQTGVFSRKGCERIMRYAYELARRERDADFHLEGQCARLLDGVLG